MHPQIFGLAQVRNLVQRVNRACVDRSSAGSYTYRHQPSSTVSLNLAFERIHSHTKILPDGNFSQVVAAESEDFNRFLDTSMTLYRSVNHHCCGLSLKPLRPNHAAA